MEKSKMQSETRKKRSRNGRQAERKRIERPTKKRGRPNEQ